jgi:UDPglucose--hexose-1-phosphate uridylyltransferase
MRRYLGKGKTPALAVDATCPFCPGNETQLLAIITEMPSAQKPGWRTRVVPNKFPAVGQETNHNDDMFYQTAAGRGHHEVVIESPRHDHDLTTMSEEEIRDVLATCHNRYVTLMANRAIRSVTVFRNRGERGGASLVHPHTQLIALDIVVPLVHARQTAMTAYYRQERRCLLCDIIDHERETGLRVVAENDAFLTVVPFAASAPCEMWLLPKRHRADFRDLAHEEAGHLAITLHDALTRLAHALDDPPYNYVIDTAAKGASDAPALHWRLRITPRVTARAGFELGSSLPINPSPPEVDAAILRFSRRALKD